VSIGAARRVRDVLRTIFIGSKSKFSDLLVHWLAQRTNVVGVIWLEPELWRRTWRTRLAFLRWRIRRRGVLKALDETAFYLVYGLFFRRRDRAQLETVLQAYRAEHGSTTWHGDAIATTDVNAPEVLAFARERKADVGFAMCVNEYFGRDLRTAFEHGIFLWHEGITPEYRGLYSPFWALHNLDFDRVGYSLLRMSDDLDAGDVYAQGRIAGEFDPRRNYHLYLGHKAIADSLPAVATFLAALEVGTARPLERAGESSYYSYPGLTDLVRQRWRLRRAAAEPRTSRLPRSRKRDRLVERS
jgi:hypothetical protein